MGMGMEGKDSLMLLGRCWGKVDGFLVFWCLVFLDRRTAIRIQNVRNCRM